MLQFLNDAIDFVFRLSVAVAVCCGVYSLSKAFEQPDLPQVKAKVIIWGDGIPDNGRIKDSR